jgi:RimJ/RimL family protein N-acetyltransferase
MDTQLFLGEQVRLAAYNLETDAEAIARWSRDSEYWRLVSPRPFQPSSVKQARQRLEDIQPDEHVFAIRTRAGDRFIGGIGLWANQWTHGDAWVGIHIGEREYWGKGL